MLLGCKLIGTVNVINVNIVIIVNDNGNMVVDGGMVYMVCNHIDCVTHKKGILNC